MALKLKSKPVANEGEITAANIIKLKQQPVAGNFDADHLREINRRVLEGIPSYNGGQYRIGAGEHVRSRSIDAGMNDYVVHYKTGGVKDQDINNVIARLGPIKELSKLPKEEYANRISKLYSDLDHIHPFNEANSRTLRLYTEQISKEVGYKLEWPKTNVSKQARDELYKARDVEVSKRSHPDLTVDKMRFATTSQIEAYQTQKLLRGSKSLEQLFKENITPEKNLNKSMTNPYLQGKANSQKVQTPTNQMSKSHEKKSEQAFARGKR